MSPPVADAGGPLLLQTGAGPTLRWKGVDFYPGTDPVEYARRKARVFSLLPRTLCFVPSLGLGHGLEELLQAVPPDSAVLCVEAFQEVMGIALQRGIPRDSRLRVARTEDPEAAVQVLRDLGTGRFRRVVEVPLCAGYRLAPRLYAAVRRRLEQEIMRFWQNRLTMIAMGSLQVRNVIANLPLLPDAGDFSALSTDLPVVVAGAGPSLERSLPLLARLRERLTLLAVDTALPTLRASGLVPDVVLAVEAQAVNNQDFIPAPPAGTVLACDLSVHPSAARLFSGRVFFFSSGFASLSLWERLSDHGLRPTPFPALGSVGVAAVHAALRLTRESVFLTGLDFSYPDQQTHSRGSPFALSMLSRGSRFDPVGQGAFQALAARRLLRKTDKRGRPVLTDRVMGSYRDGLEAEAHDASGRIFDCGETGLPLGVRQVSERELEELLPGGPLPAERLRSTSARPFPVEALRPFVRDERALLARLVREAAGHGPSSIGTLLAEADYTWAHFPDQPDLSSPDRSFVARARVAAMYYDERLRRIQTLL
jgi:hypothetical protein